ncbi:MAG TPA: hypothetical protein VIV60_17530 [Polyangiaceae bacterium]
MLSYASRIKATTFALTALVAAAATLACGSDDSGSNTSGDFWPGAYDPAGAAVSSKVLTDHPGTGHPGACLKGCHEASGSAVLKLAYGGMVFQADKTTPAGNVQVGVSDGTHKSFIYSASNGYYWAPAASLTGMNWNDADYRIRNAKGERPKLAQHARGADCDDCHKPSGSAGALTVLP